MCSPGAPPYARALPGACQDAPRSPRSRSVGPVGARRRRRAPRRRAAPSRWRACRCPSPRPRHWPRRRPRAPAPPGRGSRRTCAWLKPRPGGRAARQATQQPARASGGCLPPALPQKKGASRAAPRAPRALRRSGEGSPFPRARLGAVGSHAAAAHARTHASASACCARGHFASIFQTLASEILTAARSPARQADGAQAQHASPAGADSLRTAHAPTPTYARKRRRERRNANVPALTEVTVCGSTIWPFGDRRATDRRERA